MHRKPDILIRLRSGQKEGNYSYGINKSKRRHHGAYSVDQ